MSFFRPSPARRHGPALLDQLPVGVSVYRLDDARDARSLRLIYSNPASGRLVGLDIDTEVGRRIVDILPGLDGSPILDAYAEVARTGTARDLGDVTYGDARVDRRTYRVEAIPLAGRSVGVLFEDVTDRDENQSLRDDRVVLAREEARYRTLVEATAAIVWSTSAEGAIVVDQPSWRAFTGQSVAEHLGDGWTSAIHPDDRKRTVEVWAEAVRTRSPYALSHRVRRADGAYRTMSARGTPVLGDDGAVVEWVGVHTDVEDHDSAALALAASEARFRTLFDALGDPVLVYPLGPDGPGPMITVNQAAVDRYGYSAGELRTMTVADLLAPGSLSAREALDELRRARQATFESVHLTRDGRAVPVQTAARLVTYEDQLCVLAVVRDDTERRAFQNELSRANLGLERTVAARTDELQAFADALKILHGITTEDFDTPAARTDAYLHAGCAMFGLPVGILSATPLDEAGARLYRIEAIVSPDPSISPGMTVPIGEAFCDAVLEQQATVSYGDAAEVDALACHPAYATRGLRAFIGTPIRIDGEIVGTLNFVSPAPRPDGFRASDRDLVEIMADAIARRMVADRAETQRRQVETYYRTVVETVEDGLITLDADCRITMSNPSARLLLGLRPEARHGERLGEEPLGGETTDSGGALVPAAEGSERGGETDDLARRWPVVGEDGQAVAAADLPERVVLRTGAAVRGAIQGIVHPGGTVRWYRVNAAPIDHDDDGTAEAVVLSYTDVTDFRAASDDARRSAALLTSVQAASPDGVMAFRALRDDAGTIVDFEWLLANPRSAEISGRPGENLVGRRLLDVFPGNAESGLFDAYRRVTETGDPFRTTMDYAHDGLTATLRITASPLDLGGDGSPDGFSVAFTDVPAAGPPA